MKSEFGTRKNKKTVEDYAELERLGFQLTKYVVITVQYVARRCRE